MKPVYQLTRSSMIWLACSIILVIAPFFSELPLWLFVLAGFSLGWRLMVHSGRWSFPHWSVRGGIILLVFVGLILELKGGSSITVTVTLLASAFLLKLTEMYHRRDALVVLYVAMLLIACSFIFHQGIPMSLYALACLVVVTACLNTVYRSQQNSDIWRPLKRSALLYAQALPMMLVLFLIFPRIGPLWQMDLDTGQSFTGLSDSMAPGDVSRLTRSGDIAFRVSFNGELPPESQRYWRGITYDLFDGRRWTRSEFIDQQATSASVSEGEVYDYQVVMEPTGQLWRYGLDLPVSIPVGMQFLPDLSLSSGTALLQRGQYNLRSRVGPVKQQLSPADRAGLLELPDGFGVQARDLAAGWLTQERSTDGFIRRMLQHFNSGFSYTLEPPQLTGDTIDQFLFQSRRGFCGHFAGAGVFLLRSAGIPARVVGGYQGGELNPLDGDLTVRQYEAHAWLEYWDSGRWHRLDPTAAVAPERVEQPADQLFSKQQGFLADATLLRNGLLSGVFLKQLRLRYEALNYSWHRWVLNFHKQQAGLLQRWLGELSPLKVVLVLLIPGALVVLLVAGMLLLRNRSHPDPLMRALQKIDRQLQRYNRQRKPGESVQQFCQRLGREYPQLQQQLAELARCYDRICYAGDSSPALARDFIRRAGQCSRQLRFQ